MDAQPGPPGSYVTHEATDVPIPHTRLSGRRLLVARVAWAALATVLIGFFAILLPVYWTQLRTVCAGPQCANLQPSPTSASALRGLGVSVASYAEVTLAASILCALVGFTVAGVIVWRKSDDWMALLVALMEVGLGGLLVFITLQTGHSRWQFTAVVASVLDYALLFLFAALFPSGRFVPRWIIWLLVGWATVRTASVLAFVITGSLWLSIYNPVWLVTMAGAVVGQIYRYRAVSRPWEQAQTRWVVLGSSAAGVIVIVVVAPAVLLPVLNQPGSLYRLASLPAFALAIILVSLSVGIAILRHRLYDIDVIIRRTLIYSIVTGALAAIYVMVYVVSSVLLQAGFQAITGQASALAIVGSTVAIWALFQPVRSWVRASVDRRFYRRHYDASRTLTAFGATLRNEMELAQIRERVLAVVEETMQPSQVSLWLARPARKDEPEARQRAKPAEAETALTPELAPLTDVSRAKTRVQ